MAGTVADENLKRVMTAARRLVNPGVDHIASTTAATAARGRRLGRTGIATAETTPATIGRAESAASNASVHTAVAGMSLIDWTTCESSTGLNAIRAAVMTPAVRLCSRVASQCAPNTVNAAKKGPTKKGPFSPATSNATAMKSGRPGGYVGTISAG